MTLPWKMLLLGILLLGVLLTLPGGGWYLFATLTKPTLERHGGTVLIYEVDKDRPRGKGSKPEQMAVALKRRIDPTDAYNVTVRPVGDTRFEIVVPHTNNHEARLREMKELIAQVGALEFRVVANDVDDKAAIGAARGFIQDPKNKAVLQNAAEAGKPPPPPQPPEAKQFFVNRDAKQIGPFTYSWVELGPTQRADLALNNAAKEGKRSPDDTDVDANRKRIWEKAAEHRNKTMSLGEEFLLYSRECQDRHLPLNQRQEKAFEYFLLLRNPEINRATGESKKIAGQHMSAARADFDERMRHVVAFKFDAVGSVLFYDVTSQNLPDKDAEGPTFHRHLAIILDGQIVSAPRLITSIRDRGQISADFTPKEVERLVNILNAGALPMTLKPWPVSEVTVEPTKR